MTDAREPRGVHLVGSVNLSSAEEVFRTASKILGRHLYRLPDGETGDRSDWIVWQFPVFENRPQLEVVPPDPEHYRPLPRVQLRDGADASELRFDDLGYAAAARSSWRLFERLQQRAVISSDARFQVSLPTPLAPIGAFVMGDDQAAVEPAYERRMLDELDEIIRVIPNDHLAIQWDTAVEFGILEGLFPPWFDDVKAGILERLSRIGHRVPPGIALGYHLCYGDANHQHFKQPEDMSKLVEVANGVAQGVDRPIDWIHMPVPRDRDDDAYFEPLRDLSLSPETELYVGLVHFTDKADGARRRIATARRHVDTFGVATECGMGRRSPETIRELMAIHADVSAPLR